MSIHDERDDITEEEPDPEYDEIDHDESTEDDIIETDD